MSESSGSSGFEGRCHEGIRLCLGRPSQRTRSTRLDDVSCLHSDIRGGRRCCHGWPISYGLRCIDVGMISRALSSAPVSVTVHPAERAPFTVHHSEQP
eukprot:365381-Chlamydomonas_euryale.AAC.2